MSNRGNKKHVEHSGARVVPIGPNQTELHTKKYVVLYSYETPVAARLIGSYEYSKTEQKYSSTTSKHINAWIQPSRICTIVPQATIDKMGRT